MSVMIAEERPVKIVYPESDGNPMSENTVSENTVSKNTVSKNTVSKNTVSKNTAQFRWIVTLQGGLDDLFRDNPMVFVAGDLLWYPVMGNNRLRAAPDAMVVFGRSKGDRGSYL